MREGAHWWSTSQSRTQWGYVDMCVEGGGIPPGLKSVVPAMLRPNDL